jgi:hypothetical protein
MRHQPTFGGALVAQNSLLHHHRAPTPWGGGAAPPPSPPWRWRTDGAMAQGSPTCPTRAEPQMRQVRQQDGRRAGKRGNVVSPEPDIDRRFLRAADGPAVTLDSPNASPRCLTAWPRSNESTGFPAGRSGMAVCVALAARRGL